MKGSQDRSTDRAWLPFVILAAILLLTACIEEPVEDSQPHEISVQEFEFEYEDFEPVDVLIATSGDPAKAVPLLILHGMNRNNDDYLASWLSTIEGTDAILIAPKFDEDAYPSGHYALGGMSDSAGDDLNPRSQWTFNLIEPMIAESLDVANAGEMREYDIFGHSAGSQFVHRYLEFMPEAQVHRAVAANAGWYTLPDPDVPFPYGLDDAPDTDVDHFLQTDLVVLLGEEDTEDDNLRQSDEAEDQGRTRIERGHYFYDEGLEAASDRGVELRWTIEIVPGVGHDQEDMAEAAAKYFAR